MIKNFKKYLGTHHILNNSSLLLGLSLIFIQIAIATPSLARDQVGIYWDPAYSQNSTEISPQPGTVTGYVVIQGLNSYSGILGWELCVEDSGDGYFLGWDLSGQAINRESAPCFAVGLSEPLVGSAGNVLLATFQYFVADGRPVSFSVRPIAEPSVSGRISYIPASNPDSWIPLNTTTGSPDVAWINRYNPWPDLNTSTLDFGAQPIGGEYFQDVTVTNIGGTALDLDLGLSSGSSGFALLDVSGQVSVPAGATLTIPVSFSPTGLGAYACDLELGGNYPTALLVGIGREVVISYAVSDTTGFGELPTNSFLDLPVFFANTGDVPFDIVPALTPGGGEFVIITGGSPVVVAPLETAEITVRFQPTSLGSFESVLVFGDGLDSVVLQGTGRLPIINYSLPDEVVFGTSEVGIFVHQEILIQNTGEVLVPIAPALVGCGENFEILWGGDTGLLYPGDSRRLRIRFQPATADTFTCSLTLGAVLPEVLLSGRGVLAVHHWTIWPRLVEFPPTMGGESPEILVIIRNTGQLFLNLNVSLAEADGVFSLVNGPDSALVHPGDAYGFTVRFQPVEPGTFATEVLLGDTVPPIPVSGSMPQPVTNCDVVPAVIEFGTILVSRTASQSFTIRNTGNQPLSLDPVVDSPYFTTNGVARTLTPGAATSIEVTFSPLAVGEWDAVVATGSPNCAEVICHGIASEVNEVEGPDQIGIFFDEAYSMNELDIAPFTPVMGYLAFFNPTNPSGISAWECAVNVTGNGVFMGWWFEGIGANNLRSAPEFQIEVLEPLPSNSAILLASIQVMVLDPSSRVQIFLDPISGPSVPGKMVWKAGNSQELRTMNPVTGTSFVAAINGDAPVGTVVPTPLITSTDGQVHLSWPDPGGTAEGCHVFRRAAGSAAERLTSRPLSSAMGSLEFTDNPVGFAAGTTLYYSYSIVANGIEQALSPEAEFVYDGLPARITRLLPNVPNPFNPMTVLRFELSKAAKVNLSIFDVSGRKVRTLLESESFHSGLHESIWRGKADNGQMVAAGVYFYRLDTGEHVETKSMTLVK